MEISPSPVIIACGRGNWRRLQFLRPRLSEAAVAAHCVAIPSRCMHAAPPMYARSESCLLHYVSHLQAHRRYFRMTIQNLHTNKSILQSSFGSKGLAKVVEVLTLLDPNSNGLPLSTLAAELEDDVMEAVVEAHGGLREFLKSRNDLFLLSAIPPHGRFVVRRRIFSPSVVSVPCAPLKQPTAPKAQASDVSTIPPESVTSWSKTVKRKNKKLFIDCWNTTPSERNLAAEHSSLIRGRDGGAPIEEHEGALSSLGDLCGFPRHLTPLSNSLAQHMCLHHGTAPPSDDEGSSSSEEAFVSPVYSGPAIGHAISTIILPKKEKLYSVALLKRNVSEVSAHYNQQQLCIDQQATSGRCDEEAVQQPAVSNNAQLEVLFDALNSPEFTRDPSKYILLVCSHPALQARLPVYDKMYESSPLGQFLLERRSEPQEYDAYRLARFVEVENFVSLGSLLQHASTFLSVEDDLQGEGSQQLVQFLVPLLAVVVSFPQLFQLKLGMHHHSTDKHSCGGAGIKFQLDEHRYLPLHELEKFTEEELERRYLDHKTECKQKATTKVGNKERVRLMEWSRYYQRVLSIKQKKISACDPNVLAYWIFDEMEALEQPRTTGRCTQDLPMEVQVRTNGRSKSFQNRYPHLFRVVAIPPEYYLYRADWPIPATVTDEEASQLSDQDLLTVLIGAFLDRKKTRRAKPIYTSSLVMLLPQAVVKRLRKSGGIHEFLARFPEVFKLTGQYIEMIDNALVLNDI